MSTKICSKCNIEKIIDCFTIRKDTGSYRAECKECVNKQKNKYYKNNKEKLLKKSKEYAQIPENKEKRKIYLKEYEKENVEYIKDYKHNWYEGNKERLNEKNIKYRETNREKILYKHKVYYKNNIDYITDYWKKKAAEDPIYRLKRNIRVRINIAIKNNQKVGSAIRDLGCSIDELKLYFEDRFYINLKTGEKMNWDNYGEWHIDHIKPLSSFDLNNREQFIKACHYTNLQPLWAEDNFKKGAR